MSPRRYEYPRVTPVPPRPPAAASPPPAAATKAPTNKEGRG
jgi:hypothetical protein